MRTVSEEFRRQLEGVDRHIVNKVIVSAPMLPPLGQPNFEHWANFDAPDVIKALRLQNGSIFIVRSSGYYKVLALKDVETPTHWGPTTSWYLLPRWPADSVIWDASCNDDDIRVFAVSTTSPYYIWYCRSRDHGANWGNWNLLGISTLTQNNLEVRSLYDTVILKHYESVGLCFEVFTEESSNLETANYITNDSFEVNTTGYQASGGTTTLERVTDMGSLGSCSLKVSSSDSLGGVAYGISANNVCLLRNNTYRYTVSFYSAAGRNFRIFITDASYNVLVSVSFTATGAWQDVSVLYTALATANHYFYVTKDNTAGSDSFYIDNVRVYNESYSYSEQTTNRVKNPSCETDSTGWSAQASATLVRSAEQANFGTYSLKVTPTATSGSGALYGYSDHNIKLNAGQYVTFSAYVRGVSGVTYTLSIVDSNWNTVASKNFTGTGAWKREAVSYTVASSLNHYFYVTKSGSNTDPFYIDNIQVEDKASASTYCDGTIDNCYWIGTAHASYSYRGYPWTRTTRQTFLYDIRDTQVRVGLAALRFNNLDYIFFSAASVGNSVGQLFYLLNKSGVLSIPRNFLGFEDTKGTAPLLRPGLHSVIDQEGNEKAVFTGQIFRQYTNPISDTFENYASNWYQFFRGENSDAWVSGDGAPTIAYETTLKVEGSSSMHASDLAGGDFTAYLKNNDFPLDLRNDERFGFLCFWLRVTIPFTSVQFVFHHTTATKTNIFTLNTADLYVGASDYRCIKKSDFLVGWAEGEETIGDWEGMGQFDIVAVTPGILVPHLYIDNGQFIKADPADDRFPNPTGDKWNFQPQGFEWCLTKDDPDNANNTVLAITRAETDIEKTAIRDVEVIYQNYTISARILNRTVVGAGKAGFFVRCTNQNKGEETGYAIWLSPSDNKVYVHSYVNGTPTSLASAAFTCNSPTTWYYLSASLEGPVITVYASDDMAKLFDESLLVVTDTTHTSGKLGFISIQTTSRFDDLFTTAYTTYSDDDSVGFGNNPILAVENALLSLETVGDIIVDAKGYLYSFDRNGREIYRALSPFASDAVKEAAGKAIDITNYTTGWQVSCPGGSTPQAGSALVVLGKDVTL